MTSETGMEEQLSQEARSEEQLFPIQPQYFAAIFYLVLLVWFGYIAWRSRQYETADTLFLYIVLPPTTILTLYKLLETLRPDIHKKLIDGIIANVVPTDLLSRLSSDEDSKQEIQEKMSEAMDSDRPTKVQQIYEMQTIIAILTLGVLVYLIGFVYALPMFVFLFVLYYERSFITATAVTAGFTILMNLLFMRLLNVVLWDGIIELI